METAEVGDRVRYIDINLSGAGTVVSSKAGKIVVVRWDSGPTADEWLPNLRIATPERP